MPKNDKTYFILRKRHLPPEEIAAQTGLSIKEVNEILRDNGEIRLNARTDISAPRDISSWFWPILLALAVILTYLPVLKNGFVNWDDQAVIVNNLHIRHMNWTSMKWMFTNFEGGYWMPLTWLSLAITYKLGGEPWIFHAINVLLHVLNTVLVFGLSIRLLKAIPDTDEVTSLSRIKNFVLPVAILTALLFGLHPIHVESVAWATERKDVLFSFFYMAALWMYLDYAISPVRKSFKLYVCLGLYLMSLLSKPMAVTLPFVFLILDFWPLQRLFKELPKILMEKFSFFVLTLGSILVTFVFHGYSPPHAQSGVEFYWILNAFRSMVFYPLKMIFPWGLTALYPFPPIVTIGYLAEDFGAVALVVLATYYAIRQRRKAPYLLSALLYYFVTLAPVLGFIQNGTQAAADRYTYLPSLGLFLLAAAFLANWTSYSRLRFGLLALVLAFFFGFLTVGQIGTWKDSKSLWERVRQVYPEENPTFLSQLGETFLKGDHFDEALAAFSRACSIPPPMPISYEGLGTAMAYKDRIPEAIHAFNMALSLDPKIISARHFLWNVYEKQGRHEEAISLMKEGILLQPQVALFRDDLGVSYTVLKRYPEAEACFQEAHRLDPGNSNFLVNLATINQWEGKIQTAIEWYRRGIALNPQEPIYYLKLGDLYLSKGNKSKALEVLEKAWSLHPQIAKTVQRIGEDFQKLGKVDLAEACFSEANSLLGEPKTRVPDEENTFH